MSKIENSIAIVYICTGEYKVFWKDFYLSFEEKFISTYSKDYYVFTDSDIYAKDKENVHVIYQENLGWPGNTLFRYKIFLTQKDELLKYEYVFFMNANVICVSEIGEEFLPKQEGILFVQHPGFYNKPRYMFPYDRNRKSKAYIPYRKGNIYICGGVNGGKSDSFIKMCEVINRKTDQDYNKGIIAKWHDESHINKYFLMQKESMVLDPGYCYPEDWDIPFKPFLMVRDKSKYIDVDGVKGKTNQIERIPLEERVIYFFLAVRWKVNKVIRLCLKKK